MQSATGIYLTRRIEVLEAHMNATDAYWSEEEKGNDEVG